MIEIYLSLIAFVLISSYTSYRVGYIKGRNSNVSKMMYYQTYQTAEGTTGTDNTKLFGEVTGTPL